MACAFVAGAASLVWSRYNSISAGEVRRRLQETAVDLGTSGRDPFFGHGRVDPFSALQGSIVAVGGKVLGPDRTQTLIQALVAMSALCFFVLSLQVVRERARRKEQYGRKC